MKNAIRPDFFNSLPSIAKDDNRKDLTDEERFLYGMSNHAGWKVFSEIAEQLVKELDQMNDVAVSQGMTYEELGKNTVVISLAKGIIRKLMDKVSDSKEACEGLDAGGK